LKNHVMYLLLSALVALSFLLVGLGVFNTNTAVSAPTLGVLSEPLSKADLKTLLETGIDRPDWEQPETSGYETILEHAQNLSQKSELLILSNGSFDPLKGWPKSRINALHPTFSKDVTTQLDRLSVTQYKVIQFDNTIGADTSRRLRAAGMEPVGYIPNNAYLVAITGNVDTRLIRFPGIRWAGNLPTQLKVSKRLQHTLQTGLNADDVFLQIAAYRTETMDGWPELAAMLGAEELIYVNTDGLPRMMLRVSQSSYAHVTAGFAQLPGVENIRLFDLPVHKNYGSIWLLQSGNENLQSTPIFDAGITGIGQVYGAVDSGLDTDGCQFRYDGAKESQALAQDRYPPATNVTNPDGKVLAYYVMLGSEEYDDAAGHYHGTMTTGCAVGDSYHNLATQNDPGIDRSDGMAPGAQIVFQDVGTRGGMLSGLAFHTQYEISQQAYYSGVRVHNNSYGSMDPNIYYDQSSASLDQFMWEKSDYTIFWAAGNEGPGEKTLGGGGSTAKNTVVIGASMPAWKDGNDLLAFSSRGPTSDGRIKPDLVAPGLVESATESEGKKVPGVQNVYGKQAYESNTVPPNNQCAVSITQGTSFSAPTAAGMGILVRQYFTDGFYPSGQRNATDGFNPSAALIKAMMINGAQSLNGDVVDMRGQAIAAVAPIDPVPSIMQGWGRITLDESLYLKGDRRNLMVFADIHNGEEGVLETDDVEEYEIYVKLGQSLRVSLVWIDPPAISASGRALVNDLDLEVVSPSGILFWCTRS